MHHALSFIEFWCSVKMKFEHFFIIFFLILTQGTLADRFGYKTVLVMCIVLSTLGTFFNYVPRHGETTRRPNASIGMVMKFKSVSTTQ